MIICIDTVSKETPKANVLLYDLLMFKIPHRSHQSFGENEKNKFNDFLEKDIKY